MSPGVDFRIDYYVIKDVNKEPLGSGVLMENPNLFTALKIFLSNFPSYFYLFLFSKGAGKTTQKHLWSEAVKLILMMDQHS